jgi:8-oxo-dGTP diphosphatase
MHEGAIEFIARGVLIGLHGILLCHSVGKDYMFLPGGHITFGESAANALIREFNEEIGMKVDVSEFLGAMEHKYDENGNKHHEITLVFLLSGPAVERRTRIPSIEKQLEFQWHPITALTDVNLLPKAFRQLIPQWTRGKQIPWSSDLREWV